MAHARAEHARHTLPKFTWTSLQNVNTAADSSDDAPLSTELLLRCSCRLALPLSKSECKSAEPTMRTSPRLSQSKRG